MDEKLKGLFNKLDDKQKIDILWDAIMRLDYMVFENTQLREHLNNVDTLLTPDEILQRKEVWSKTEVCDYFGWTAKTFERSKKAGEIRVVKVGGKDYCRLTDLKDRFRDRGE